MRSTSPEPLEVLDLEVDPRVDAHVRAAHPEEIRVDQLVGDEVSVVVPDREGAELPAVLDELAVDPVAWRSALSGEVQRRSVRGHERLLRREPAEP